MFSFKLIESIWGVTKEKKYVSVSLQVLKFLLYCGGLRNTVLWKQALRQIPEVLELPIKHLVMQKPLKLLKYYITRKFSSTEHTVKTEHC